MSTDSLSILNYPVTLLRKTLPVLVPEQDIGRVDEEPLARKLRSLPDLLPLVQRLT
jgi:hypothetical protein